MPGRRLGIQTHMGMAVARPSPDVGLWVPSPPSSYVSTGTVAYSTVDATIAGGSPGYALFFPSLQHTCQNQYGIFQVYNSESSDSPYQGWFRLKQSISTDAGGHYSGASWTQLYDSKASSQPTNTWSPAVETDAAGAVYVLVSNHTSDGLTRLYKFSPPSFTLDGGFPVSLAQPPSSGKRGAVYDQGRNWMWILIWEITTGTYNLVAVDRAGAVQYKKSIFKDQTEPHGTAGGSYPIVDVARDGTIFVGWSTEVDQSDGPKGGAHPQSYYDIHFIYSTDSGATFIGANNSTVTLPVTSDDSGVASNSGYQVVDTTSSSEFIVATDANYYPTGTANYNWNHVTGMAYNNSCVHFAYTDFGNSRPAAHNPYARFKLSSQTFDKRVSPNFQNDAGTVHTAKDSGVIVRDTTQAARIYWVGTGAPSDGNTGKIIVFRSDDNGTSWNQYAVGSAAVDTNAASNGLVYTGACRWVQSDGSIIGSTYSNSGTVYFFRVTPN